MQRPVLPALLATLLLSPAVQAQSPPQTVPETIVTATRVETGAERVPAAVTILDRATIEERGYATLAEALAASPGLRVVAQGGPGQLVRVFMRGANSNHTLVLLDGVPINDPSSPDGAFDAGQDLLGDIERVEILRGPFASLYGSGAIGGAINLVTRRAPRDRQAAPFGEIAGGTQGTLRLNSGIAGTIGRFDYLGVVQYLRTAGFNVVPPRIAGPNGERDAFRGLAATLRLGWTLDDVTRVEGLLRWRGNRFGLDRFGADDPNFDGDDRRLFGQVRAETAWLGGALVTGIRAGRVDDRRRYLNAADPGSQQTTDDLFRGSRTFVDLGNRIRLPSGGPLSDALLSFGATWERQEADSRSVADFGFGPSVSEVRAATESIAVFGGVQARLFDRFDGSLALRRDNPRNIAGATTWRAGLVVNVPELDARLFGGVGTGFRVPSLDQLFGISAFVRGNPDLLPEQSFTWDLGAEWQPTEALLLSATAFGGRVRNLVAFQAGSFVNIGRARFSGVELSATLRLGPTAEIAGAWTITGAFNDDTDQRLLRRPENVWTVSATLRPMSRLTIVPSVLITGRARDFLVQDDGGFGGVGTVPGGVLANLTATWALEFGAALFAEARNLGNARFEPTSGYVVPSRSVLVGTRFQL